MSQLESIKLSWDEFQTSATFREIYKDQNFQDVTLASEDHKQIKAHRVVLSASSAFFKEVFSNNPHPNPLLYLKGIKFVELEMLIKFIYFGEAEVPQKDLSRFLFVASELQVKGLCNHPNNNLEDAEEKTWRLAIGKDEEEMELNDVTISDWKSDGGNTSSCGTALDTLEPSGDKTFVIGFKTSNNENFSQSFNDTSITVDKGNYKCDQCDSTFKYLVNLIPHIKKKHGGINYECKQCNFQASNNYDLYKHLQEQHGVS